MHGFMFRESNKHKEDSNNLLTARKWLHADESNAKQSWLENIINGYMHGFINQINIGNQEKLIKVLAVLIAINLSTNQVHYIYT